MRREVGIVHRTIEPGRIGLAWCVACSACVQGAILLGAVDEDDAKRRAERLGFQEYSNLWLCPDCVDELEAGGVTDGR